MVWDNVFGQQEAIDVLRRALESNSLSHAYLFFGPPGVGKRTVAKGLASVLNCEKGGCGGCPSCLKVAHETHPDVFHIEPEGNFITIGQVRELQHEAELKPFEGFRKVCVVDDVDSLTSEAASALLKILEEPPSDLTLALLATNLEGVLPTIVSRCQLVRFKAIPPGRMAEILVANYGFPPERARLLTKISGGILGDALDLANSPWRLERRGVILGIAQGIPRADALELAEAAEELILEVERPLERLKVRQERELKEARELAFDNSHAAYLKRRFGDKHKRERNRWKRRGFEEILDIFASWYRDLMILVETFDENLLVNVDQVERLKEFRNVSTFKLSKALEIVHKSKEILRFNVNALLAFEVMLFKLREVLV